MIVLLGARERRAEHEIAAGDGAVERDRPRQVAAFNDRTVADQAQDRVLRVVVVVFVEDLAADRRRYAAHAPRRHRLQAQVERILGDRVVDRVDADRAAVVAYGDDEHRRDVVVDDLLVAGEIEVDDQRLGSLHRGVEFDVPAHWLAFSNGAETSHRQALMHGLSARLAGVDPLHLTALVGLCAMTGEVAAVVLAGSFPRDRFAYGPADATALIRLLNLDVGVGAAHGAGRHPFLRRPGDQASLAARIDLFDLCRLVGERADDDAGLRPVRRRLLAVRDPAEVAAVADLLHFDEQRVVVAPALAGLFPRFFLVLTADRRTAAHRVGEVRRCALESPHGHGAESKPVAVVDGAQQRVLRHVERDDRVACREAHRLLGCALARRAHQLQHGLDRRGLHFAHAATAHRRARASVDLHYLEGDEVVRLHADGDDSDLSANRNDESRRIVVR